MPRRTISNKFSEKEQAEIKRLLDSEIEFVDHPEFHRPWAEKRLFDAEGEEVPEAEVGWYLSYMNARDNLATWDSSSRHRNVLLTREQESRLFLRFNFARFKLRNVVNEVNRKGMTIGRGKDILRWHHVVLAIRKQLAEMNLAMVLSVAQKHARGHDDGEAVGIGNEKLMAAIEHFDVSTGYKFSTYVWYAIMRAVVRRRKEDAWWHEKFPCGHSSSMEKCEQVERPDETPENLEVLRHLLDNNLAQLTDRERMVIILRYLEPRSDGSRYGLAELGEMLDVSRTCVQIAERTALQKLRKAWMRHLG